MGLADEWISTGNEKTMPPKGRILQTASKPGDICRKIADVFGVKMDTGVMNKKSIQEAWFFVGKIVDLFVNWYCIKMHNVKQSVHTKTNYSKS